MRKGWIKAKSRLCAGCVLMLMVSLGLAGCTDEENTTVQPAEKTSELNGSLIVIGGDSEHTYNVISEETIKSADIHFNDVYDDYRNEVYQEVVDTLSDSDNKDIYETFFKSNGVYVSKTAIYEYSLRENNIRTGYFIVPLFSEDMSVMAAADVTIENGKLHIYTRLDQSYDWMSDIKNMPDESFVNLSGMKNTLFSVVLSQENEIYRWSTKVNFDITIEGDPYHALPYEDISFSYEELTDKGNLVWLEF